jgi:hypothetical protein
MSGYIYASPFSSPQATLTVDDGRGGMDTAQSTVTITPANQPPQTSFTVEGDLVKLSDLTVIPCLWH